MKIKTKLILAFILCGIIPLSVLGIATWYSTIQMESEMGTTYQNIATDTLDKIERNLFERYGDVQAFGLNYAVNNKENWYIKDSQKNHVAKAMNSYVTTYGIYYLTIFVDTTGKVIAVNDIDASNNAIDTKFIYDMNFASAKWFKDTISGNFLKSEQLTGTVVEDLHIDNLVKQIYKNEGLTLGYTAPVYGEGGKLLGAWKNFTSWQVVEDILVQSYDTLAAHNIQSGELTILDSKGRVLIDCDPTVNGKKINRDMDNVILKLNLVEKNVQAAQRAVNGEDGHIQSMHARKKVSQVSGFAHSQGALGYPGLGWSALVRINADEALAQINSIRLMLAGLFVVTIIVLIGVALLITRSIINPIKQMLTRLQDIAEGEGDLTKQVNEAGKDELSMLGHWFNVFIGNVRDVIIQVRTASEEVADAAAKIASSADEMANGLSQQSQQTTQVSAAIEQMNATVSEVASKSNDAAKTSQEAGNNATSGGKVVQKTVTSIRQIAEMVNKTATAIDDLGTRSEQIGQIIDVINDIADQTNLLALNAAIEAARAGEHGRGFAVVADEVRKLAERTTQATQEVSESITAIQTQTQQAVKQMNVGTESVSEGVEMAEQAGDALKLIVNGSDEVVSLIDSIAAASTEQSQAVGDIARNVESISSVTRQTTEGATQAATAASQLSHKAEELQGLINRFKTN